MQDLRQRRKRNVECDPESVRTFLMANNWQADNPYRNDFHGTNKIGSFFRLMAKSKNGLVTMIWKEFAAFAILWTIFALVTRLALPNSPVARDGFGIFCTYCARFRGLIPISFLTGFYVSQVVSRFWSQYASLPYNDGIALAIATQLPGKQYVEARKELMRYVNMSNMLTLASVSKKVKRDFLDNQTRREQLIKQKEFNTLDGIAKNNVDILHELANVPITWAINLLDTIADVYKADIGGLKGTIIGVEATNRKILSFGWVSFPLAYAQVVNISIYMYLIATVFASQPLVPPDSLLNTEAFPNQSGIPFSSSDPFNKTTPFYYLPFFTIMEAIAYLGWIRVAENLINPFGEDENDLDLAFVIDRNVKVGNLIVSDNSETNKAILEAHLPALTSSSVEAFDGADSTSGLPKNGRRITSFLYP